MRVITVSREYGAGGGEAGRRLAEALGWELLDRELLHRAAAVEHVPDADLERLDEQALGLADRFRLHPPHQKYMHGLTEAVRQAVARGNVVLVGRGTRQLAGDAEGTFHLRLVATAEWRVSRMAEREGWSWDQALARCDEVDRARDRFMRYFFGAGACRPEQFDLTVNAGRVPLEDVVACVAALARGQGEGPTPTAAVPRVLTLARELGAGDTDFARALAERLRLHVYDRELLEQEALRLGVSEAELEAVDEQPAGLFGRLRPGGLPRRYLEAMGQLLGELATRGDALLVGRGGSRFLRDRPGVFHARLVAAPAVRVRRVMEHHWLRESAARQLIAQSDALRGRFYEGAFGADWASPLEYHLTVNAARLGPAAVDAVALAAGRHWSRAHG
ncbi:MAG TPA: cytidylate kinase-like family protein [Gemmataceae bacterium]|jgi:cytidylate kinase|nr:cytidylate kinase-like family protein [Gemmataceae bacterium]